LLEKQFKKRVDDADTVGLLMVMVRGISSYFY